jgi:hypothetical protein
VKKLHNNDLAEGYGEVYLPTALSRKYSKANISFGWQYLFPSTVRSTDPRSGKVMRHHLDKSALQKAVSSARIKAGIINVPRHILLDIMPSSGLFRVAC